MSSEKYTLVEGGILIDTQLAENSNERYPLFLDATSVRRMDDNSQEKEATAARFLTYLDESGIDGYDEESPDVSIMIGFNSVGYGVYGMEAEIKRPTIADRAATLIATRAMRQMAYDLGTYPKKEIPMLVYAHVLGDSGLSFETNPAGACSMDTDGYEYKPTSDRITLHSHNLYTHQMQLICISGIIALAKAG